MIMLDTNNCLEHGLTTAVIMSGIEAHFNVHGSTWFTATDIEKILKRIVKADTIKRTLKKLSNESLLSSRHRADHALDRTLQYKKEA